MFDLEKEVLAWSEAMQVEGCRKSASSEELVDHLYCEIDRARKAGLSDEEAFAGAVVKLGKKQDLSQEHAKNRSLFGTACAAVARYERASGDGPGRQLLIAHAIVWAALMIALSAVLSKAAAPATQGWLLTGVMVPCWWASELVLRRALRGKPAGLTS